MGKIATPTDERVIAPPPQARAVAQQFVRLDAHLVRAEFERRYQESREQIRAESSLRFHLRQLLLQGAGVLSRMALRLRR
jgi:hypothetical protein